MIAFPTNAKQKQPGQRESPHSNIAERQCIGAALRDREAYFQLKEIVGEGEPFYIPRHQVIFNALGRISLRSDGWDLTVAADELERHNDLEAAGGHLYLIELARGVATTANIEHHARIVRERYERRLIIRACTEAIQDAYEGAQTPEAMTSALTHRLLTIPQQADGGFRHIKDLALECVNRVQDIDDGRVKPPIVATGFSEIDALIGGFGHDEMVIIAARPSVGKSALMAALACNVAREKNVGVVSVEMGGDSLTDRMVLGRAGVTITDVRKGNVQGKVGQILQSMNEISELNLWIDDGGGRKPTMDEIMARAMAMNARVGLDLLLIDYLQLIPEKGKDQYERVTLSSNKTKLLARMINAPVVMLSQVNRSDVDRPTIKCLRDSGAIEQDADQVWMLWGPTQKQIFDDPDCVNTRYVGIDKNRNGPTGEVKLYWNPATMRFDNLSCRDAPARTHWNDKAPDNEVPF